MTSETVTPLFGGALQACLPLRYIDVSNLREVPDNQEVFVASNSDDSIIIEILEYHDVPHDQAAEYHFRDIAEANDATNCVVQEVHALDVSQVPNFPEETPKFMLVGQQSIAKYREEARNVVEVLLFLVRLPELTTDILVSYHFSVHVNPQSSSAPLQSESDAPSFENATARAKFEFTKIMSSFKINDFSLFSAS